MKQHSSINKKAYADLSVWIHFGVVFVFSATIWLFSIYRNAILEQFLPDGTWRTGVIMAYVGLTAALTVVLGIAVTASISVLTDYLKKTEF